MLHLLRNVHVLDEDTRSFIREISQTVTRSLALAVVCIYLVWAYLLGASQPGRYLSSVLLITLPVVLSVWASLALIEKRPTLAHLLWLTGLFGAITLGWAFFQRPEIALFYLSIPLIAVIVNGWALAIFSELLLIGTLAVTAQNPAVFPMTDFLRLMIGVNSVLIGFIGALAKPALVSIAILAFLGTWNDFVGPLLYIKSPDLFTVSIGLAGFRSIMRSRWDLLMAASTAMTVPVIALFFAAQRYFFESGGITLTGLK